MVLTGGFSAPIAVIFVRAVDSARAHMYLERLDVRTGESAQATTKRAHKFAEDVYNAGPAQIGRSRYTRSDSYVQA
jgi:hypothetical protein